MLARTRFHIVLAILLIILTISCASQVGSALPVSSDLSISFTPTIKNRGQKNTPRPGKQKSPLIFPTSAYSPATSNFNLILGRPTSNSITASAYSKSDTQIAISYGITSGKPTSQTSITNLKANVPQNIELMNLEPNTTYYYRVLCNGSPSVEHSFQTQRSPDNSFTFTIDADQHNRDSRFNGELYATTLTNVVNDKPDFHVNLGDTFMTEKLQVQTYAEAESSFTDMRPFLGISGADVPLFLVNGNHEGELGWLRGSKDNDLPVWSTQLRQLYYPNPVPNNFYSGASVVDTTLGSVRDGYYSWTWGDALFVVLDPFWYTSSKPQPDDLNNNWNWTLGKPQYDWLKTTLETSNAKYKFVFSHHLVGGEKDARGGIEYASFFEWGGNNADGTYGFDLQRPGWGLPIHQLFVQNHVSAVFHGHDHVFVKQDLDGIVYQELPQPSNAEYNNTRQADEYGYVNGTVFGSSGHLRVTVSNEQVMVDYVRSYLPKDETVKQHNGQVDYSYTIQN
jgi:hypothetical protein